MAAHISSSLYSIGAPTTIISRGRRRSQFPKPLLLSRPPNFSSFNSVNPNPLSSSPIRRVLPPIYISASDSSQNSADPGINPTADVAPSSHESTTAVGFSGDLAGGEGAATSAVVEEKQIRMEALSDHGLELALLFLVIFFCNNVFMLVLWRRRESEEERRRRFEGSGSTVDRCSETEGEDVSSSGKMVGIRAVSMDGSDEGHVVVGEETNGRLRGLFLKGRNHNPTMLVSERFIIWGRQEGCRGLYGDIRARSSRLKYSVNEDIFDGMRTKRNSKESKEEEDEYGLTLEDMWWRTLPYVNAIYINMGSGEDIFFTFKMLDRPTAYLVTFEDHTDATNFCYTCHTSFDDPDKFKAATIPLTLKDMLEITELKHVIVVRRGQFKFYVGQPFHEIEMALRSLIMRKLPFYDI